VRSDTGKKTVFRHEKILHHSGEKNVRTLLQKKRLQYFMILAIIGCLFSTVKAAEKPAYLGWEQDSPYNKYYNYKERDSLKGKILKFIKVTPLPGMSQGTAFILDEGGEKILVHLCPTNFSSPKETGIRTGVKTKVKGCWALINGEDVFIAAKVKQGDNFVFKVRLTIDGRPFWSMSPEELAKEHASN
jgi:hypothetical protein